MKNGIAINAGTLKEKIKFIKIDLVSDGAGGFELNGAETIILDTFGSIKQIKASRQAENLQEAINAVYQIKIRMRAGFNPQSNYIIRWQNKDYSIISIEEDAVTIKEWTILIIKRGAGL